MYRASSPYRSPESLPQQPYGAASPGQIVPGSITYTTSTDPTGNILYHPFKAVAASYQTPSGIVSGIQWVPAEATQIMPSNAQPATTNFAESWHRGNLSKEDQKALKEWQRSEDKRRKKEEKESKVIREKHNSRGEDSELRIARERDAAMRERRKSINQGGSPYLGSSPASSANSYPAYSAAGPPITAGYPGYPAAGPPLAGPGPGFVPPGVPRDRKQSTGAPNVTDLNQQFVDMNLGAGGPGVTRPRKYSTSETMAERARKLSGNFGAPDRPATYGAYGAPSAYSGGSVGGSPYPPAAEPAFIPKYGTASPGRSLTDPFPRSTSPSPYGNQPSVYPPGHILEGKPMPVHRSTTPAPAGIPGPGVPFPGSGPVSFPQPTVPNIVPAGPHHGHTAGSQQLAAPEGFSRPINAAESYTPFETMKIQDMDDFLEHIPRMPMVLKPHDVYVEDWSRLMEDLSLSWSGRLPVPNLTNNGRPPKRATLTADLIDLWNASFFLRRGVEVVLYKGRERRSGQNPGVADLPNHLFEDDSASDSSVSESDLSDDDEEDDRYGASSAYGVYGRPAFAPGQGSMAEVLEARRRRQEMRTEKKRRRREKKIRQKARAREKRYSLYLTCVRPAGPGAGHPIPGTPGHGVPTMPGGHHGYGY